MSSDGERAVFWLNVDTIVKLEEELAGLRGAVAEIRQICQRLNQTLFSPNVVPGVDVVGHSIREMMTERSQLVLQQISILTQQSELYALTISASQTRLSRLPFKYISHQQPVHVPNYPRQLTIMSCRPALSSIFQVVSTFTMQNLARELLIGNKNVSAIALNDGIQLELFLVRDLRDVDFHCVSELLVDLL